MQIEKVYKVYDKTKDCYLNSSGQQNDVIFKKSEAFRLIENLVNPNNHSKRTEEEFELREFKLVTVE